MRAVVSLLVIAALGAVAWYWLKEPEATPAAASTVTTATASLTATMDPAPTTPAKPTDTTPAPSKPDFARAFRESTDFLLLIEMLHEHATKGDPAAQYWLSVALPICEDDYEVMFWKSGSRTFEEATLDEALAQYATDRSRDPDEIRTWHAKCQTIRAAGFRKYGDWDKWLEASSDGGYPLGQIARAYDMLLDDDARRTPETRQKAEEAKQLAIEALRDVDPEVVLYAARIASLLADENDMLSNRPGDVWTIAACLRGADCSPEATWVRRWCRVDPACHPFETGLELMRRNRGLQYEARELRTRQINALIDAKDWAGLEFN